MTTLAERYRFIRSRDFYMRFFLGVAVLAASIVFSNYANNYTAIHSSTSVSDIILDNVPVTSVETAFLEGFITLIFFVVLLALHKPARMPFVLTASALFICIRAFFLIYVLVH